MEIKTSMITGITGMDGTILANLLLKKGHKVIGVVRRNSTPNNLSRLSLLLNDPNLVIVYGDITDAASVDRFVCAYEPDELYHLAANSFVGISWDSPTHIFDTNTVGTINCLEAIRKFAPDCRFYFAGSSEQFGNYISKKGVSVLHEESPMCGVSPYGVSKVAGYQMTKLYRESYDLFASCGILFNHCCNDIDTPIITKINNKISIQRIVDLLNFIPIQTQTLIPKQRIEVWDGDKWSKLNAITIRPTLDDKDLEIKIANTRHGIVRPTNNHNMLNEFGDKVLNQDVIIGDHLLHGRYPTSSQQSNNRYDFTCTNSSITKEEAELIGIIVGDGCVLQDLRIEIGCTPDENVKYIEQLLNSFSLNKLTIGQIYSNNLGQHRNVSFSDVNWVKKLDLYGSIYNSDHYKKVPDFILNATPEIQLAFLRGYNFADGLKANKCKYEFKNFKTNSIQLAQGLLFLIANTTKQDYNINYEYNIENDCWYYSINLLTPNKKIDKNKENLVKDLISRNVSLREIARMTGFSRKFVQNINRGQPATLIHPLFKNRTEIKKIINQKVKFVADICLDSGKFMAGAGTIIVANSELRGTEFFTRKVTSQLAKIKLGKQDILKLGNLQSKRDEGYSGDYCQAMYLMLQHSKPDDFVIASGQTHSCQEWLDLTLKYFGLARGVVDIDENLFRPNELFELKGDASKAQSVLGWKPTIDYYELNHRMCKYDMLKQSDNSSNWEIADRMVFK